MHCVNMQIGGFTVGQCRALPESQFKILSDEASVLQALDQLLCSVKSAQKQKKADDICRLTAALLVNCLLLYRDGNASVIKRICKISGVIERTHDGESANVFIRWLNHLCEQHKVTSAGLCLRDLYKWSTLLENSDVWRKTLQQNLPVVIALLSDSMYQGRISAADEDVSDLCGQGQMDAAESDRWHYLGAAVKVCVQLFQQLANELTAVIWTDTSPLDGRSAVTSSWQQMLSHLMQILASHQTNVTEDVSECLKLAGLSVSLVIISAPSPQTAYTAVSDMLQSLEKKDRTITMMGKLRILVRNDTTDIRTDGTNNSNELSVLSVLSGITSLADSRLLSHTPSPDVSPPLFIEIVNRLLILCQSPAKEKAFQVLKAWFRKISQVYTEMLTQKWTSGNNFSEESSVLKDTLSLIWVNLESAVDGIKECVCEIFRDLMALHNAEVTLNNGRSDFPVNIAGGVIKLNWQVKGRYRLLSLLVPHIGSEKLLEIWPLMWEELLQSSTNHFLSQAAANVYRAFVLDLKGKWNKDFLCKWEEVCMIALVRGLTSDESTCRRNVSLFWLPWTLERDNEIYWKLTHHVGDLMLDKSADSTALLSAWLTVAKTGRNLRIHYYADSPNLREALFHQNDEIRSEALTFLCNSPRKAEVLSDREMALLRESLPLNLNIDSAAFRHQLRSNMQQLIIRVQGSSFSLLRKTKSAESAQHKQLCDNIDFLNWLCELCINCLFPGACFQRCKTALDWLEIILDSMTSQPIRKENKTTCSELVKKLVSVSESLGKWTVVSRATVEVLVDCVVSGTDEIQQLAADLILKYLNGVIGTEMACDILSSALVLISCPRARQCQSGALLASLIYQMFLLSGKQSCIMNWSEQQGFRTVHLRDPNDSPASAADFLIYLSECGRKALKLGETDVVLAADNVPAHGILLMLDMCIQKSDLCHLEKVLPPLVCLCEDVIDAMMAILSGQSHGNAAPSFEEMGVAIENLIGEENGTEEEVGVALSDNHQKILSWAWLNLKVSCNLMCTIAHKWRDSETHTEHVMRMARKLIHVQTKCRHKGVIESCSVTIKNFCLCLLRSRVADIRRIPAVLLDEVLDEICSDSCAFSTTRRSAGLPLLIRSILAAYSVMKQHGALHSSLTKLFNVLDEPLKPDVDPTRDVPQVHALHILKALFRDAGIAHGAQPFLERALVYSIHGFSEPHWSIRNGATTLFGTVIWRMVGQKKSRDVDLKTVTTAEFMVSFPAVLPSITHYVHQAVVTRSLCPSVLPALTVLSQLTASPQVPENLQRALSDLQDHVALLASHPMYGVRHLSACALMSLIGSQELWAWLTKLVKLLPSSKEDAHLSMNAVHGLLLQLGKMFASVHQSELSLCKSLVDELLQRWWLADPAKSCHMISAEYLSLLHMVCERCRVSIPDGQSSQLWQMVTTVTSPGTDVQICREQFLRAAVKLVLNRLLHAIADTKSLDEDCVDRYHERVRKGLSHTDAECRVACLQHLRDNQKTIKNIPGSYQMLMDVLAPMLLTGDNYDSRKALLELMFHMWEDCPTVTMTRVPVASVCSRLNEIVKAGSATSLAGLTLPVWGMFVKDNLTDSVMVSDWCESVEAMSRAEQPASSRLQAARALRVTALQIFTTSLSDTTTYSDSVIRLVQTTFNVLQDEDADVRMEASRFVSQLCVSATTSQGSVMQSNKCAELFCAFVMELCDADLNLVSFISETIVNTADVELFTPEKSTVLYESEDVNIYAEKVTLIEILHRCVKKRHFACVASAWLKRQIETLKESSEGIMKQLFSPSSDTLRSGILKDKHVFSCLIGLAIWTDVLFTWCAQDHQSLVPNVTSVCSALSKLLKLQCVHPSLKAELQMCCSTENI